jgi:hypothetical protein
MNKESHKKELEARWAAIEAKNKKWLKDTEKVVDDSEEGVCLGPTNQKSLNQMEADLNDCKKDKSDSKQDTP